MMFYLWSVTIIVFVGIIIFLVFFIMMEFKNKCIKQGAACQVCFSATIFAIAIITYILGFITHSTMVVNTAYCGHSDIIFYNPKDTLPLMPDYIRKIAETCLYGGSNGNLFTVNDNQKESKFHVIHSYLNIVSMSFPQLKLDQDQSMQLEWMKSYVADHLDKYKSGTKKDFTREENLAHGFQASLEQINNLIACTCKSI